MKRSNTNKADTDRTAKYPEIMIKDTFNTARSLFLEKSSKPGKENHYFLIVIEVTEFNDYHLDICFVETMDGFLGIPKRQSKFHSKLNEF